MYIPSDHDHTQCTSDNNTKADAWHASVKSKRDAAKRKASDGEESGTISASKKGKVGSLSLAKSFKAALIQKVKISDAKINDVINAALLEANDNDDKSK